MAAGDFRKMGTFTITAGSNQDSVVRATVSAASMLATDHVHVQEISLPGVTKDTKRMTATRSIAIVSRAANQFVVQLDPEGYQGSNITCQYMIWKMA